MLERTLTLRSGLLLPNRLVKAAMSEGLATGAGTCSLELERLYGRQAARVAPPAMIGNLCHE